MEDCKASTLPVVEFEDAVLKAASELYKKTGARAVRVKIDWSDCWSPDPMEVSTELES